MTAVQVRPARPEDAERVAEMARVFKRGEGRPSERLTADVFRRDGFGNDPKFRCLVIEAADRLVGFVLFARGYSSEDAAVGYHIDDLYLEASHRRRGIGRRVMSALARRCRDEGGAWLAWHVVPKNESADAFYDRLGAVRSDLRFRYLDGDDMLGLAAQDVDSGGFGRRRPPTNA